MAEERRNILRWILGTSTVPQANYNAASKKHLNNTTTWLLHGRQFSEWRKTPNSFLWLVGKGVFQVHPNEFSFQLRFLAGSGKTVLWSVVTDCFLTKPKCFFNRSSSVIEALETDESPCAFFFFDRRDGQAHLQSFDSLICSITYQLCSRLETFPEIIMKTYSNCGSGSTPPSHLPLQNILVAAIQHLPTAFIVMDALDECHEIAVVGSWMRNLVYTYSSSLHVLFTSRDMPLVSDAVERIPHETIRVNECTTADIELFITESMMKSRLRHWPRELQETIKESLYERADGM